MMAERGKSISGLTGSIPQYVMTKGKVKSIDIKRNKIILIDIRNRFKGEKFNDIDGLRIDFNKHKEFKGGWVHLRPSNTEPIFRIISEGRDADQSGEIYNYFVKMFSK
jgi:phosphomannomutase